jgi:hypothetical protein
MTLYQAARNSSSIWMPQLCRGLSNVCSIIGFVFLISHRTLGALEHSTFQTINWLTFSQDQWLAWQSSKQRKYRLFGHLLHRLGCLSIEPFVPSSLLQACASSSWLDYTNVSEEPIASETIVLTYQNKQCHVPEDCSLNIDHCRNLRSRTRSFITVGQCFTQLY